MDLRTGGTKADVTPLKSGPAVDRGKKLFVAMPADFTKGQDTEKGSGEETQQALRKELEGASVQAVYAPAPQGMQQALAASRNAQCAYLIDLSILDWDDPPASFQKLDISGGEMEHLRPAAAYVVYFCSCCRTIRQMLTSQAKSGSSLQTRGG